MTYTKEEQKANRKLWVEALRSGKYKQCRELLKDDAGYCCLGVLCEVAGLKAIKGRFFWFYEGDDTVAPALASRFVGLTDGGGNYKLVGGSLCSLTENNDAGYSFEQIADIIESEPEGLFEK